MAIDGLIGFLNTTNPEKALLRIAKAPPFTPLPCTVLGFQVSDIALECKRLIARGVSFERYPQFDQDELGVWRVPSGAQIAWFKDPDGNLLSLTQWEH